MEIQDAQAQLTKLGVTIAASTIYEILRAAGIDVEIVPGVTAGLAAPALRDLVTSTTATFACGRITCSTNSSKV